MKLAVPTISMAVLIALGATPLGCERRKQVSPPSTTLPKFPPSASEDPEPSVSAEPVESASLVRTAPPQPDLSPEEWLRFAAASAWSGKREPEKLVLRQQSTSRSAKTEEPLVAASIASASPVTSALSSPSASPQPLAASSGIIASPPSSLSAQPAPEASSLAERNPREAQVREAREAQEREAREAQEREAREAQVREAREAQMRDAERRRVAATYGAGPGFTGAGAGESGFTGLGAGQSTFTGIGAGSGFTNVGGGGSGFTGILGSAANGQSGAPQVYLRPVFVMTMSGAGFWLLIPYQAF